ncbi:MAG: hypothetical protein ACYTF6_13540 [Planctomycetota bacterium]|jgi:hypothetical protein
MALTIAATAVDAWAEVAQNAVREGAAMTISDSYVSHVYVDIALSNTTAHTGTRILLQVSSESSTDEFWVDLVEMIAVVGTANTEAITNNPAAAGTTVFTVADTTGYAADGALLIFIEDATAANSELMLMVSHSANTSVTVQDGSTREHANTAVLSNVAESFIFTIPLGFLRARVIFDNTYDSDGATVFTRTRVVETTALT